jgi:hypothetical protein
VLTICL